MRSNGYIAGLLDARALFDADRAKICDSFCHASRFESPRLEDCDCGAGQKRANARSAQEVIDELLSNAVGCIGHNFDGPCETCGNDTRVVGE